MNSDELLTTTRAVRKRLDFGRPVPRALVVECVEIATQAPSGSNSQNWHFVIVEDKTLRAGLAELYRDGWNRYLKAPGSLRQVVADAAGNDAGKPEPAQMQRVLDSAQYLAEHIERVPVLMIPCVAGRSDQVTGPYANAVHASTYGSILPATWSFMLAARSRGLGTAWTTAHLVNEREAADLLGIPYDSVTQVALIPTAWYLGESFRPARRLPAERVLHFNGW